MKYRVKECESIEMMIREREVDGEGGNYLQHMEGIEKNITYIYVALSQLILIQFSLAHSFSSAIIIILMSQAHIWG